MRHLCDTHATTYLTCRDGRARRAQRRMQGRRQCATWRISASLFGRKRRRSDANATRFWPKTPLESPRPRKSVLAQALSRRTPVHGSGACCALAARRAGSPQPGPWRMPRNPPSAVKPADDFHHQRCRQAHPGTERAAEPAPVQTGDLAEDERRHRVVDDPIPCRSACHVGDPPPLFSLPSWRLFHRPRLCQAKVNETLTRASHRLFALSRRQRALGRNRGSGAASSRNAIYWCKQVISPKTNAAAASSTTPSPFRGACHGGNPPPLFSLASRRLFHRPRLCQAKVNETLTCASHRLFALSRRQRALG
jgi:hypothetical protein